MILSQFLYIAYTFSTTRISFGMNAENVRKEVLSNITHTFLLSNFIFLFIEGPLITILKKCTGLNGRLESIKNAEKLILSKSLNDKDVNGNTLNDKHDIKVD